MPDDETSGAPAAGEKQWQPPPPEPDYGAGDYIMLPDFGIWHFSLEDAALLSALDMWNAGSAPGVPAEGLPMADDDEESHDHQDDPLIRAALDPLRAQVLAALVRSAEAGHLEVEVRGRTLADSRLIPGRTFVHLHDLVDWLSVHGHERSDIIADVEESLQEAADPWVVASDVAQDRARFRLAHVERLASEPLTDEAALRAEVRRQRLHIAHLEQQLDEVRRGARPAADKPLKTRERRTMLTIIGALCRRAGIDPASRGAAVAIAGATEEIGAPVDDDSIRKALRQIPDAIESRSR